MELLAEPNWIDTSIEFCRHVLMTIREDVKICDSLNMVEYEYSKQSPVKDLLLHIRILTEMSIMMKTHDINISIREYTQVRTEGKESYDSPFEGDFSKY
jgi:hypothetical protein